MKKYIRFFVISVIINGIIFLGVITFMFYKGDFSESNYFDKRDGPLISIDLEKVKEEAIKSKVFIKSSRIFQDTLSIFEFPIKKQKIKSYCNGNFVVYNKGDLVMIRNVTLDLTKKFSKKIGGEEIEFVMNQQENDEYVKLFPSFFKIPCNNSSFSSSSSISRGESSNIWRDWYKVISFVTPSAGRYPLPAADDRVIKGQSQYPTVLHSRKDYANLYWTLKELYEVYLSVKLMGFDPALTKIILMDAHPKGSLDGLWSMVFPEVSRVGCEKTPELFISDLIWPFTISPIVQTAKYLPYLDDFKIALYKSQGVDPYDLCLGNNRKPPIIITLILRKDYVAHPRNPTGKIMRKIENEAQLVSNLTATYNDNKIGKFSRENKGESRTSRVIFKAIQLDALSLEEQIKLISQTSILIGVHGAGLAYSLLLKPKASIIELFPSSYKLQRNPHFQQYAIWGQVNYYSWYSNKLHDNEWIYIPPEIPIRLIDNALINRCIERK